ncbi:MAG: hypothetical protein K6A23_06390 [Butyrivibrio sp.]|nr:hypothetical protein [Butyrivibrio sp.]
MLRLFKTNDLRKSEELSGSGWTFIPLSGSDAGSDCIDKTSAENPNIGKKFSVVVPGCIESIPGLESFRGTGKYSKVFKAGGNIRLVFKGVSHTGTVYLDGKELGKHYNAYTPFSFLVKNLPEGNHFLEVLVDNRFSEESALHVPNDYMTYMGITRGVAVERLGDAYIEYLHIVPEYNNNWNLNASIKIVNLTESEKKIHLKILLPRLSKVSGETLVEGSEVAIFEKEIELKSNEEKILTEKILLKDDSSYMQDTMIFEWSPETPVLYNVKAKLSVDNNDIDDLIERIGFRTVKAEGRFILLNGKKLRIKGFCRHEDHPMYGCALPLQAMEADLQIVKDLGGNAIRTSHYPNDEMFLDLCDERGIIVWEENHARGLSEEQMKNPNFEEQAEKCIEEMINAHINHPSIIIWGILNECASETEYGRECYKKQYELIKKMDDSRPRSSASCKFMNDICLDLPDIVSYNIYPEWYVNKTSKDWLDENYDWVHNESGGSGKPFIISEIGAGAIYGYRSPIKAKWTEEYQAEALRHQIKAVLEKIGCSGIFIWQFSDCRISYEWFSTRPRTMNNKGIVDEYRRPKLSYDVVKEIYTSYSNYFE